MFLKSNKVMCFFSESLVTYDVFQGLRSRVICCGKAQRHIRREILGISIISKGLRSSRVWCIGNMLHPVRCESLGSSDISEGLSSYNVWCCGKASHPRWSDNLKSPTDISSLQTQFILCLLDKHFSVYELSFQINISFLPVHLLSNMSFLIASSLNLQICFVHCFISLNFLHFINVHKFFWQLHWQLMWKFWCSQSGVAETQAGASGCIDIQCSFISTEWIEYLECRCIDIC
jgi:hypothetical protein